MSNDRTWIQGYSGLRIDPLALKPEQVALEDIAHALSQKCRFTGHTKLFYSVAQHSVIGSHQIAPPFALAFLLHEVSEAYLPDIARPIKSSVFVEVAAREYGEGCLRTIPWRELESRHANVIFQALGLSSLRPLIDSHEVKTMDVAMLATEKRDCMSHEPEDWNLGVDPLEITIYPVSASEAEKAFINRFYELTCNNYAK